MIKDLKKFNKQSFKGVRKFNLQYNPNTRLLIKKSEDSTQASGIEIVNNKDNHLLWLCQ